jgi:hypothetical protein
MVYHGESLNATSTRLPLPEVMMDFYFQIAQSIARTEIYNSRPGPALYLLPFESYDHFSTKVSASVKT